MAKVLSVLVSFVFLFFTPIANATTGDLECGLYELRGTIEKNEDAAGYIYYVNKGTMSQFKITIPRYLEPNIVPYIERYSKVRAKFSKPIVGYLGKFSVIESIELAMPDPLGFSGNKTLVQISKGECGKRLGLWITDSIGATNGSQCDLMTPAATPPSLPDKSPTLTEEDVSAWDPDTALWTLNPSRIAGNDHLKNLEDHCFVLAIDGKMISSGIVLSSYSARLIHFPTLTVFNRKDVINLKLTQGNYGLNGPPINVWKLDVVLDQAQ